MLASHGHTITLVWQSNHLDEAASLRYRPEIRQLVAARRLSPGTVLPNGVDRIHPARLRDRIKPDIVQGMYLVQCGWTAAQIGRPLVQFALGSDVLALDPIRGGTPRRVLGAVYRKRRTSRAVRSADAVLCDSSQVAGTLQRRVPGIRTEVIRIGVEIDGSSAGGQRWREELDIVDDALVVLSTRLLHPNYNITTIVRAVALVLETIPRVVLILKDFESFGDPSYRVRCRSLIRELGIDSAVRFVGELPRPDLLALYRAADVFLSVPTNDATAVSVLEAMAASVPVVASRTDGLDPDVLRDHDTALLVRPGDVDELARAIVALNGELALRDKLVRQGLSTVRELGDFECEIEKVERLYAELAAR
jgi:glycosyltransferase involved in cell wall biosynthesis